MALKYPINRKARREAEVLAKHMLNIIVHALGMKPLKKEQLIRAAEDIVAHVEEQAMHGVLETLSDDF